MGLRNHYYASIEKASSTRRGQSKRRQTSAEISDIHDLNLRSSVFDFGEVKLARRASVCKPLFSGLGIINP